MKKIKHRIPLFVLVFIWAGLAVFSWLKPADAFSESERRKLAEIPELEADSFLSGRYFQEFEKYSLDQFPMRDTFRTLKSVSEFYLFGKSDNNEIYISDGYAAKIEYPLDKKSVQNAVEKFDDLYTTYVKDHGNKVYLSMVPDKGYFLAEKTGHPVMDYEKMFAGVRDKMPYAEYIDLAPLLELSDYYKTDSHWKQEKLVETAQVFAERMGISISGEYEKTTVERPFYGVYYGQSALPLKSDSISYLSNKILDACTVYNAETGEMTGLYHPAKLESRDMYEVYLSGASPLLVIENPNAGAEKELVVFRDSFASSLIPLLAEGYSKITLVDTRYMQPAMIGQYVDFSDADVLYLYSTTVLNNSGALRR